MRFTTAIHHQPWRLRLLAGGAALLVSTVVATALVHTARSDPHEIVPAPLTTEVESECIPVPDFEDVDDVNAWIATVRGGSEFQGADVGADVTLQDGRRLWVFGDTLRPVEAGGNRFVRNSMLVLDDSCAKVVLPADRGALIPDRADGIGYWPMSISVVGRPGHDLVAVTAQRVETTGAPGDSAAFVNLGPAVADFVVPVGGVPHLVSTVDVGVDSADRSRPTWGAASTAHDGWVYLYATAGSDQDLVFGFSLRVARVRPGQLRDVAGWEYWDGTAWVSDPSQAVTLIEAEGGVSQTLSVFEQDGAWYAVSKRDGFTGSDLVSWKSPSPTGPFVPGPAVADIPSTDSTLRYMPLAHPQLLPREGTIVVSYSRNDTDLGQVSEDPFLYRPHFLRVPLP